MVTSRPQRYSFVSTTDFTSRQPTFCLIESEGFNPLDQVRIFLIGRTGDVLRILTDGPSTSVTQQKEVLVHLRTTVRGWGWEDLCFYVCVL